MQRVCFLILTLVLLAASGAARAVTCAPSLPTPFHTPRAGWIDQVVFDPECKFLYALNTTAGTVDILALATGAWEAPIPVLAPRAMELSPDGKTLYVGTNGKAVAAIDLATRREARRIAIPSNGNFYDYWSPFMYLGPSATTPKILRIAALPDGALLVNVQFGQFTGLLGPRWVTLRAAPGASTLELIPQPEGRMLASGDRKRIYVSDGYRYNGMWRYVAETGGFELVSAYMPYEYPALSKTGDVGLEDLKVLDARTPPFQVRGEIVNPTPNTTGMETAVDSLGHFGYQTRQMRSDRFAPGVVDVFNLDTATLAGRIDAGVAFENTSVGIAVAPDDRTLVLNQHTGLTLLRTGEAPTPRTTKVVVHSLRAAPLYSLLRIYNGGTVAGTAKVTLANIDTGQVVGRWESPAIPPNAAPQFTVGEMEPASLAPASRPARYVATVETSFPGAVAHVTWTPNGALANASTCDTAVPQSGRVAANVHSSRISDDYPSQLTITSNVPAGTAQTLTLDLFNARTGEWVAYYSVYVWGHAGRTLTMAEIERDAKYQSPDGFYHTGFVPPPDLTHYVAVLNGGTANLLQHSVYHRPSGVLSDMTPVCGLAVR